MLKCWLQLKQLLHPFANFLKHEEYFKHLPHSVQLELSGNAVGHIKCLKTTRIKSIQKECFLREGTMSYAGQSLVPSLLPSNLSCFGDRAKPEKGVGGVTARARHQTFLSRGPLAVISHRLLNSVLLNRQKTVDVPR